MKKTLSFVFAAIAVLTVASCAREMFEPAEENLSGEKVTFTLSLAENGSKTALEAGKTVWADGDSILLADGSKTLKVGIPAEAVGQKEASISINLEKINVYGDLYAVYPPTAYKSVSSGNVVVAVPSDQSGNFDEANICVAKCTCPDNNFALKNATALLKITVEDDVETVMISAAATDTLAGNLACTYKKDTALVVKAASPVKSVKLAIGGVGGEYYVAVVPGTYTEFSVMALSLAGQSQRKTTTNKTLKVNDLADLGTIGDNMSGASMEGAGTEDDPFLIKDLADITTLATFVNNGLSYADNYFKVVNDIEDITIPIGTYDQVDLPFQGHFDGQNHTLTLAMGTADGDVSTDAAVEDNYLGLFGEIGEGAVVTGLNIAGTIATTGNYVGGLAAYVDAGDAGVEISNVTNDATIQGGEYVGGLIGYAKASKTDALKMSISPNRGAVTATGKTVGGIVGYALYSNISECNNVGAIEAKTACEAIYCLPYNAYKYGDFPGNTLASADVWKGAGGIVGVVYNSTVKNCNNIISGKVTAVNKAGGIAGTVYWGTVSGCKNYAEVVASGNIAGGIAGHMFVQGTIKDNRNYGAVNAKAVVGGIVGAAISQERSTSAYLTIQDNTNDGTVTSTATTSTLEYTYKFGALSAAGGIVGASKSMNKDWLNVLRCTNNGDVYGPGSAVGGVLGYFGNPRNGSDWGSIDGCVNNGDIESGLYHAGGIAGCIFDRFTTCHMAVRNCVNTGAITAPSVVAGIVAYMSSAYPANGSKMSIYNCINTGDVEFTSTTGANVWIGGIAGYFSQVDVQNCWNAGALNTPAEEYAATKNTIGILVGLCNAYDNVKYLYNAYDSDVYAAIEAAEGVTSGILYGAGKSATSSVADLYMVNSEGGLDASVTVGSADYTDVVEALNAWIGTSTSYKKWKAGSEGPEFE